MDLSQFKKEKKSILDKVRGLIIILTRDNRTRIVWLWLGTAKGFVLLLNGPILTLKWTESDLGKALDSARKREGNLKYNSSRRDEEAIELAKEAMTLLSKRTPEEVDSPKSALGRGLAGRGRGRDGKQLKKTSSTKLKTSPSPYIQKRSKSAPVKKVKMFSFLLNI